jgi:hypothetical protein
LGSEQKQQQLLREAGSKKKEAGRREDPQRSREQWNQLRDVDVVMIEL